MSSTTLITPEMISRTQTGQPFHALPQCVIAGVAVNQLTLEEASTRIIDILQQRAARAPFLIMGPNAQIVTLAQKDRPFFDALRASALNVPDGISIVLASKILGGDINARVPGGELMESLCRQAAQYGLSVFFLGGLPGAAAGASVQLQTRYPGLRIAGAYCPPPGFEHNPAEQDYIFQLLTEAAPDLLFVAFGAPKQEIWMHKNCLGLPIGAAMSVGAAFDTQSGMRKRAPRWTHSLGVEWLYRLVHEPRRLWRRYLIGNIHFIGLVLKQRLIDSYSVGRGSKLPFNPPSGAKSQA